MGQPASEPNRPPDEASRDRPDPSVQPAAVSPQTVRAAIAGDQDAWSDVVRAYARRLYALAFSRLRRADLAEEVVQSVFATVANKMTNGSYREQGQFEAWLFRIAVNRIRDQIRSARRRRAIESTEQIESVATDAPIVTDRESMDALRRCLAKLSDPDREVIELRHHAQMSFKQMAEMLNEPVGTLLARHHRALAKLRAMLEPPSDEHDESPLAARQEVRPQPSKGGVAAPTPKMNPQ